MANPASACARLLWGSLLLGLPTLVHSQLATVTLTVPDATAAEAAQDPASFTVTRTADAGTGSSLRVYLQLGGTATRSTDYATTNLSFAGGDAYYTTIAAGQTSNSIAITPVLDNRIEGDETITFDVLPWQLAGNEYQIGNPSSAIERRPHQVPRGATLPIDQVQPPPPVPDKPAGSLG
ncbi:MAG: hypothetical protein R3233_00305, partial [Xanthomonadales bacterium]|nr:hypothetical protein [Xanthomonadales bacterium]